MLEFEKIMNLETSDTKVKDTSQDGYEMIFDDVEQKYSYFVLKSGESKEIPREELLEMIKSGKSMPVIEIKEKFHVASK
jgi:hypothetical protein